MHNQSNRFESPTTPLNDKKRLHLPLGHTGLWAAAERKAE